MELDSRPADSVFPEMVRRSKFIGVQMGEMSRDAVSFDRFAPIPGVDANQVEQWMQAIKVDAVSALEWKW